LSPGSRRLPTNGISAGLAIWLTHAGHLPRIAWPICWRFQRRRFGSGSRVQLAWTHRARPQRARRKTLGADDLDEERAFLAEHLSEAESGDLLTAKQLASALAKKLGQEVFHRLHLRSSASSSMAQTGSAPSSRQAGSGACRSLQKKLLQTLDTIARAFLLALGCVFCFKTRAVRTHQRRAKLLAPCPCDPLSAANWSANTCTPMWPSAPPTGRCFDDFAWVDARLMSIFLAQTAAQFPNDFCVMFLDGAGWHTAHELTVPANMRFLACRPTRRS